MSSPQKSSDKLLTRGFVTLLGHDKYQSITTPLLAILLSLLASSLLLLVLGKSPITAFISLLQGSGLLPKASYAAKKSMFTDLLSTLNLLTPMIFAALGVAVALKAGLFNIGISGQMLVGGFFATITVGYSDLPMAVAVPLVLIVGAVCGGAVGALIGWLKHKFNINEVVSSIMLNYIFSYIISFFINTKFVNAVSRQSQYINPNARLTLADFELFGLKMDIPLGFLLTIPAAILVLFLLNKTRTGYEIKVVGLNKKAAGYAGIRVGKNVILSMIISGALAGLAGVTLYMGYYNSIQPGVLTSVGFDSIAVCLLGNAHPVGILFSSLLITIVAKGGNYMSSVLGTPKEIGQLITGLILLFAACGAYIRYRTNLAKDELRDKSADHSEGGEDL